MADAKQDSNTDDSSPTELTDPGSLDEDDNKQQEDKTDDESVEEVSEYISSDDEDVEDNMTLEEQLEHERRNFKEARERIANLITQVTEYQVCSWLWGILSTS